MKKSIRIVLIILLIHTTLMRGNTSPPTSEPQADFPKKVSEILTNSCYDCHTTGTKAEKAFKAMDFKKWGEYKLTKKISLLTKICEVTEGGVMPPEKYLKQHPEKALSASDIKTICNWTKKETEKLIK
ncbi:MAG: hypothetical protein AMS26_16940 [Bacteroides sp. SM23_62]|nr:MAG: hypothetical protein AMS26_16940 [Bacteroides sp. SM23_62]